MLHLAVAPEYGSDWLWQLRRVRCCAFWLVSAATE